MAHPTLMYGRKYQQGINVITAVAMTFFHIGAVAAFSALARRSVPGDGFTEAQTVASGAKPSTSSP